MFCFCVNAQTLNVLISWLCLFSSLYLFSTLYFRKTFNRHSLKVFFIHSFFKTAGECFWLPYPLLGTNRTWMLLVLFTIILLDSNNLFVNSLCNYSNFHLTFQLKFMVDRSVFVILTVALLFFSNSLIVIYCFIF